MNNTFKLRSIVLGLLVIASTGVGYSVETISDDEINSLKGIYPFKHITELEQHVEFFKDVSNKIQNIKPSISQIFSNNNMISKELLYILESLGYKMKLGINGYIYKEGLVNFVNNYINDLTQIKNKNKLSQLQSNTIDEITNICYNIKQELNSNEYDKPLSQYNIDSSDIETGDDSSLD